MLLALGVLVSVAPAVGFVLVAVVGGFTDGWVEEVLLAKLVLLRMDAAVVVLAARGVVVPAVVGMEVVSVAGATGAIELLTKLVEVFSFI